MEFRLLGPLEVRDHDRTVALGGVKQRALLALLLLNANRVVSRERLIDELWGESPPETSVASVQVYVSRLRKLLPPGTLVTRPPGYLLAVEPQSVDVQRFRRLTAEARSANPGEASRLLEEALGLWRGAALAEFGEEPFARVEGGRLEELRLVALEDRVEVELALGRHRELVGEVEVLVEAEPRRERLRAQLMLALYRTGRQEEALASYRSAREALADLGLEPTAALRQLERQILSQDPALDPPPQQLTSETSEAEREATPEVPARRKTVTVVFCDLANAAFLGESRDPEARQALMGRSFERMTAIVMAHGGSAKRLTGDAVVAVFGVPAVHEDDALRALRAALELREALSELGVEARLGVNSGEVVTSLDDALVTGQAVNLAATLQDAARAGEILVGQETLVLAEGAAVVEELEPLEVGGMAEPVPAFRLLAVGERAERSRRSVFVGRSRELELLRDAWRRVVESGHCELVTVVGEPGVGKSRLAAELIAALDATVVTGRCLSYGAEIGYWPVVEVIKQLGARPSDKFAASTLDTLMGESDTATTPDEIAWAFRKLLEQEAPLLVLFDDIQWGEDTFLDLVEQAGLLCAGPILLLCLARPELEDRRPRWPSVLRLEPLGRDEVEQLLPATMPPGLRGRIAHAAGGNPLFVTEMVTMAATRDEVVVPTTLKALLAARLDQLESPERDVLERGAVEGEVFHRGAVQALGSSEASVSPRLAALVRRELIRPDRSLLPGEDAFRFRHLLIRDAAYEALPKATRAELHERLAGWLEQYGAELVERDELAGYHLQQAHRYLEELGAPESETRPLGRRAASFLAAAGRRATVRGDYHSVARLLERALALGIADPGGRLQLQVELGLALLQTGRIAEGEALLDSTVEAATALGERGLVARALVHASHQRLTSDPTVGGQEMISVAEEAIRTFEALGDRLGLAEAEEVLGGALVRAGRFEESMAAGERALAHAQATGATGRRRSIISDLCNRISGGPMPVEEGIGRLEQLLSANRDDRVLEAVIRRLLAYALAMAGRFEEARAQLEASTPVLDEVNLTGVSWAGSRWRVPETLELLGDAAAAEQDLIAVWLHFRDTRGKRYSSRAMLAAALLGLLCCDQSRWKEAAAYLSYGQEVDRFPPPSGKLYVPLRFAARARIAARLGQHVEAAEFARTAVEFAATVGWDEQVKARAWLALAEIQRAGGNDVEADEAIEQALEVYDRKGNVSAAARVRAAPP
jgi:DNA-binding SARP family transcriptional activator